MDQSNFDNVVRLAKSPEQKDKVFSFQKFAEIDSPDFVPDPYYGSQKDFIETFQIVEASAASIAEKLKKLHT
jgi:protein-tyrosine phosphatase